MSWHNSTELTAWLDGFNQTTRELGEGPIIELVPLPTSAQFLNVIEGILSGMTWAVINNSDYSYPDDMRAAISRHFAERNKHFSEEGQWTEKRETTGTGINVLMELINEGRTRVAEEQEAREAAEAKTP